MSVLEIVIVSIVGGLAIAYLVKNLIGIKKKKKGNLQDLEDQEEDE